MPTIAIAKIHNDIAASLSAVLQPFEEQLDFAGTSALIKPNLVEPQDYTSGQTTNPALVEALIVWLRSRGAAKIAIGEGPSYFQPQSSLRQCFTATGMTEVAERQDIDWILFDEGPMRLFQDYSPATPATFYLSEHAFTWDHIVNVPVPKTHYLTTVSNAMKNLKGFIRRNDKPSFHYCGEQRIHGSVTALNRMIRPSLNIVDCTAPVHRNSRFVLAGTDIVAVDTVTSSLMGIDYRSVQTIHLGHAAGLGEMELAAINIVGDDLKDLQMNFEQPEEYLRRVFPRIRLLAKGACSGCLIPLFGALRRMEQQGLQPDEPFSIVSGREAPEPESEKALYVGQCAEPCNDAAAWMQCCPPTKEELFEFLKDNISFGR